jgi:micrococcal nuclease
VGKAVRLELDARQRDRWGRLLAYVWLRDAHGREVMANAEIVRRGYAHASTVPPNVRHAELFRALEREARGAERGLWKP